MASERSIRRYRHYYARLLRLYSKPHYERFGEGMEQTFGDLLRENAAENKSLFGCALWMFFETFAGILRERTKFMTAQSTARRLTIWAAIVALLLLIPLIGMQFSEDV